MDNVNRASEVQSAVTQEQTMTLSLLQAQTLGSLSPSDIIKVYSGRVGGCRCGCRGTYRYVSTVDIAKERGYPGDKSDVNDKQVAKVLALVQEHAEVAEASDDCSWFDAEVDGRSYTVYVKKEARS
jgi:hypothetical protein